MSLKFIGLTVPIFLFCWLFLKTLTTIHNILKPYQFKMLVFLSFCGQVIINNL